MSNRKQAGRLKKLTHKQRMRKEARNERRDREGTLRKKNKRVPDGTS